jgi:nitroreductase
MNNTTETTRKADHSILPLFLQRWSPRAMSGQPITDEELMPLFEAARWAPSTYNEQEWRFLYARRETPQWPLFFDLLMEANQVWCINAAVLAVVLARKTFTRNGNPNTVHLYDAGAAWENLALQAAHTNLVAHGMAGFDYDKARAALNIPGHYAVAAMIAIGHPGNPADLPPGLREYETPSPRRPITETIVQGSYDPAKNW